jgi:SAM-dependent methyltransferase
MSERPNAMATAEDFEFAALSGAENYRNALVREFSRHFFDNVLEVGSGIGQITGELLKNRAITRLVSIEPHPGFYAKLGELFPGHAIIHGTIDDLKGDEDWNTVVSINVLEHIADDERELKSYHRQLAKKNGTLCLFVPARPEIYAPIDRDFGHFRRYTRPELRGKLERAGFQILRLRYYNLAGYFAWWLNFCLLRKRRFNAGAVRAFDRIIFPAMHGLESRICPPPIGQSLLVTASAK